MPVLCLAEMGIPRIQRPEKVYDFVIEEKNGCRQGWITCDGDPLTEKTGCMNCAIAFLGALQHQMRIPSNAAPQIAKKILASGMSKHDV